MRVLETTWGEVDQPVVSRSEVYGCIVQNAHNTVFGSKDSAICAQAVYFLHTTRLSVM